MMAPICHMVEPVYLQTHKDQPRWGEAGQDRIGKG